MRAAQLLPLYPRAWRARYGEEFLAVVGNDPLTAGQVIDIVSNAIDARLSRDLRANLQGVPSMTPTFKSFCVHDRHARFSKRDALIGAAFIIVVSVAMSGLGIFLNHAGHRTAGETSKNLAATVSVLGAMPFTFMKGQPWKAQAVVIGGLMTLVLLITYLI